jgi:hypothetical protein
MRVFHVFFSELRVADGTFPGPSDYARRNPENKEKTPQIDRFRGKNSEKTAFGGHFLVSGQAVPRSRLYFF